MRASEKVLSLQQGRPLKNHSTLVHPGKSRGEKRGLLAVAVGLAMCVVVNLELFLLLLE